MFNPTIFTWTCLSYLPNMFPGVVWASVLINQLVNGDFTYYGAPTEALAGYSGFYHLFGRVPLIIARIITGLINLSFLAPGMSWTDNLLQIGGSSLIWLIFTELLLTIEIWVASIPLDSIPLPDVLKKLISIFLGLVPVYLVFGIAYLGTQYNIFNIWL